MQKGDLVVLVNDNWHGYRKDGHRWVPKDMKYPVKDIVYTIRDIGSHLSLKGLGLLLAEINNVNHPNTGLELCFDIRRFRKLDVPQQISEEISEMLNFQLETC